MNCENPECLKRDVTMKFDDGSCGACHDYDAPLVIPKPEKPKSKMGRPVTKTKEERETKRRQWFKDNPRKDEYREYARKRQGVKVGEYVVEHQGLFKRKTSNSGVGNQWGSFDLAHTYRSEGYAKYAVRSMGRGTVYERKETESETLKGKGIRK